MDFNPSEMQRMLLDSVERFAGDHYTLEHRRALRSTTDGLDRAGWASFAELGWLALCIPEEQGGLGGSVEDMAVLSSSLGARLVTDPFASTAVLAVHVLARSDTPRTALLEAIAAGTLRIALAHDEPDKRYDYTGTPDVSIRRSGNGLVLNGQKMLVLDAPSADMLIVSAHMDDTAELVLALVDARAANLTHASYPLIDGSRASDIRFDDVPLEADAILVSGEQARTVLLEAIDRASLSLTAQAVGSMEATIDICAAYVKERKQFGQPIGKFQSLQHIMADMFVATHQARSALYQALAYAGADATARRRALSLARLAVGEASQFVSRQAIQLHGGYGVTDEYEVSHHYRRLLVIEKQFGDLDYHARRLGTAA